MYQVCRGDCPIRAGVLYNCTWIDYRMKLLADENIPAFRCEILVSPFGSWHFGVAEKVSLQWGLILKVETDPIIYWYRVRIEKQDDIKENLSGRMLPVQTV